MRIHWSDCAVNNGPAYPAGPCDCGMLDLAEDGREHSVATPVPRTRGAGLLVQNTEADSLVKQQNLPSCGFITHATAAHLPNSNGAVVCSGDAASMDLNNASEPVIANFKALP